MRVMCGVQGQVVGTRAQEACQRTCRVDGPEAVRVVPCTEPLASQQWDITDISNVDNLSVSWSWPCCVCLAVLSAGTWWWCLYLVSLPWESWRR